MASAHAVGSVDAAAKRNASETPASLTSTRSPSTSVTGVELALRAMLDDDRMLAL